MINIIRGKTLNMSSGYLNIGNGKIYYEIEGNGDVLVLCHAGFVDSGMWDPQWDTFTQHYRVLRFDMLGFGKSDPVIEPVSRRQELYSVLQKLGISHAHLLGCSMGGEIVLDFTLEHPEMVVSLAIVSGTPSGFEMQGEPPAQLLEMLQALKQEDLERVSDLQIRIWVDGFFRKPEQVNPHVRQHAIEMNRIPVQNGTWAKADANPPDRLNPPAIGRLKEISVPTLILAGSLDHPEVLRAANLMAKEIKGAKKGILSDCGHIPNMEKPEEFNKIVLDFLSQV
jgi:pimeloyl-ACP methyl ester carboxylesterase